MRHAASVALMLAAMLIAAPTGLSAWSKWVYPTQVWTKVENTLINAVYGGIRDVCTKTLGNICEPILMHPNDFELELKAVTKTIERQKAKANRKRSKK